MITKEDIKLNISWISKGGGHGGCIYRHIRNPKLRAIKCKIIFPTLQKNSRKLCGYQCPCDKYGTQYVVQQVTKFLSVAGVEW